MLWDDFFWGLYRIWGFPEIRGTFLGVPIIRITVFAGLYWGPPILGNYHFGFRVLRSYTVVMGLLAHWRRLDFQKLASPLVCGLRNKDYSVEISLLSPQLDNLSL